jgi:hypothetical protein
MKGLALSVAFVIACGGDDPGAGVDATPDSPAAGEVTVRAALAGSTVWFHDRDGKLITQVAVPTDNAEVSATVSAGALVSIRTPQGLTLTTTDVQPGDLVIHSRVDEPPPPTISLRFPVDRTVPEPTSYRVLSCTDEIDTRTQPATGDTITLNVFDHVAGCDVAIIGDTGRALVARDVVATSGVATLAGTFEPMPRLELAFSNVPAEHTEVHLNYFIGDNRLEQFQLVPIANGAATVALDHPPVGSRREIELRGNPDGTGAIAQYQWREAVANESFDLAATPWPGKFVAQPLIDKAASAVTWMHDAPASWDVVIAIIPATLAGAEHEWWLAGAWRDGSLAIPTLEGMELDAAAAGRLAGLNIRTVGGGYEAFREHVFDFAGQQAILEPGDSGERFELKLDSL